MTRCHEAEDWELKQIWRSIIRPTAWVDKRPSVAQNEMRENDEDGCDASETLPMSVIAHLMRYRVVHQQKLYPAELVAGLPG